MSPVVLDALESALARLDEGFAEADAHAELLTTRDGVIQRFEIAMDLCWKLMRRTLTVVYDVDEGTLLSKKDIFRQAARFRLLDDAEAWLGHYEARNRTSHVYNSAEAQRTFERARQFLADAKVTLERLRRAA